LCQSKPPHQQFLFCVYVHIVDSPANNVPEPKPVVASFCFSGVLVPAWLSRSVRRTHTMTNREWIHFMSGLLDSVERELHPDAPTEDREALQAFRGRLERKRVTEARKPYERKIDSLVESRPYLFAAAHRHIGKILPPAVERAASTLKRARDLLDRAPNKSPEPTAVAAVSNSRSRRLAKVASRRWLSFFR